MANSKSTMSDKWNHIRADVKKAWNRLTDEELEKTKGDFRKIISLIEHRYDETKEDCQRALTEIFAKFGEEEKTLVSKVKSAVKAKSPSKKYTKSRSLQSHQSR